MSKAHQNQRGLSDNLKKRKLRKNELKDKRSSIIPFNKVHLDILGNFYKSPVEERKMLFVVALVDNATGYALCKATKFSPVSSDVVALLTHQIELVHKTPLVICSDGGRNLVSEQVEEFILARNIFHKVSAKHSSASHGKVERFFRTMNEYMRSHVSSDTVSWGRFQELVARGTAKINCSRFNGPSAHEKVFRFEPIIDNLRPMETREEFNELRCDPKKGWTVGLAEGTPILVRFFAPENKLSPRWTESVVDKRLGNRTYSLKGLPGKFDLKDLK
jgi:transposase InsO family protein